MSPSRTCQLRPCSNNNRMLQILKQMINIWTIFGFLIIKTLSLLWYISFRFKISHIYNFLDLIFLTWHIDFFFFFFLTLHLFSFFCCLLILLTVFIYPPKMQLIFMNLIYFSLALFSFPLKLKCYSRASKVTKVTTKKSESIYCKIKKSLDHPLIVL